VARPWEQTTAKESAGFGDMPLSPKENVRGFGWGRAKGHPQGAWGARAGIKTNTSDHFLMQQPVGYTMH